MKPFICSLFLSLIVLRPAAYAQTCPGNEIAINGGLLSHNQWRGITTGPLREFMDMPSGMTGALFITCRYFLSPRFSIGGTMGVDNQHGHLSYGNPKTHSYTSFQSSGEYKRRAYTTAAECSFIYYQDGPISKYGCLGIGYTYSFEKYSFAADVHDPSYFYGPRGKVPANPYKETHFQFTGQITAYGICYQGRLLNARLELGYGYKGMISTAIGYRF